MAKFDIELLIVFDEIYKTGSITRSAHNLGLAQPAVSTALHKLRDYFGDTLFSRTTKGMEPTPFARDVIHHVRTATAAFRSASSCRPTFNPEGGHEFKISVTDISEMVLLPRVLNYLKENAPAVRIDAQKMTPQAAEHLESGEIDLAVGFMPYLETGFYQQKLFERGFVCLAAKDHPRVGSTLTREAFLEEGHILVRTSGKAHGIIEKAMAQAGIRRKTVLRAPGYLCVANMVAQTDLLATVPGAFETLLSGEEKIKILAPPIELPSYVVKQHWHERFHTDPANRWLRQVMAQLFSPKF